LYDKRVKGARIERIIQHFKLFFKIFLFLCFSQKLKCSTGHDNHMTFEDYPPKTVHANIFFETILTEIKSETFLVDFGNLLSSIGGSLGLFLGFSCYTSITFILEYIFKQQK